MHELSVELLSQEIQRLLKLNVYLLKDLESNQSLFIDKNHLSVAVENSINKRRELSLLKNREYSRDEILAKISSASNEISDITINLIANCKDELKEKNNNLKIDLDVIKKRRILVSDAARAVEKKINEYFILFKMDVTEVLSAYQEDMLRDAFIKYNKPVLLKCSNDVLNFLRFESKVVNKQIEKEVECFNARINNVIDSSKDEIKSYNYHIYDHGLFISIDFLNVSFFRSFFLNYIDKIFSAGLKEKDIAKGVSSAFDCIKELAFENLDKVLHDFLNKFNSQKNIIINDFDSSFDFYKNEESNNVLLLDEQSTIESALHHLISDNKLLINDVLGFSKNVGAAE